jgi:hypothetical protein
MPNGREHDNPIADVVVHGREVYGPEIDSLVREVKALLPDDFGEDKQGFAIDSPLDQPPLVDLIFGAERDTSLRPRLRSELLALKDRLGGNG